MVVFVLDDNLSDGWWFTVLVSACVDGQDRLAAVAQSAALRGRDAWRSGLRWGLGHGSRGP